MLARLAHLIIRRRRAVLVAWLLLTAFGVFSALKVSERWLEQFSIPGYSAYEANQRTLKAFGNGAQAPLVLVFKTQGDVREQGAELQGAIQAAAAKTPGARISSYFSTRNPLYLSADRTTTFAEIYPAGVPGFESNVDIAGARAALKAATPAGVEANLTGRDPLYEAETGGEGPSVLIEFLIGAAGALIILLFVFGTLPAVAMPIAVAIASILSTFTLIWGLTYVTSVSLIVQFLVALVGLGVAIDYALLMIFRFREELGKGQTVDDALVLTVKHAGRAVIVSGSTVAIGLLSMVLLPIPVIRSIGIGGMLIPAVSVVAALTLLPALLHLLGHRINRLRVMPKRLAHPETVASGFWERWSRFVLRRPVATALVGLAIVALLLIPASQLNPSEALVKDFPGVGDAVQGRDTLEQAGITPGVFKPLIVVAEGESRLPALKRAVRLVEEDPGVVGAAATPGWRKGGIGLVEVFTVGDASSRDSRKTISRLKKALGDISEPGGAGATRYTLAGVSPEDRDFVRAVYGKFPYVLLFVILLTFVLLMRAFRSVVLALKAVILNLVSLGAAFGIIVFIFQQGHGSEAIWGVHATDAIIAWIPLMIFAFLYGLSMDYEVFMLSRMREAYDETGDTRQAVSLGLARTGKLVTSAALVLMFAFFVLSTGPGVDIKQFGIGLAAGIIFDATVIRGLLVPSLMLLIGRWNWWLPAPAARILRTQPSRPAPEPSGS
ncbi:MAG: MMPL family transporter [Gaiellaceae bacterium]